MHPYDVSSKGSESVTWGAFEVEGAAMHVPDEFLLGKRAAGIRHEDVNQEIAGVPKGCGQGVFTENWPSKSRKVAREPPFPP